MQKGAGARREAAACSIWQPGVWASESASGDGWGKRRGSDNSTQRAQLRPRGQKIQKLAFQKHKTKYHPPPPSSASNRATASLPVTSFRSPDHKRIAAMTGAENGAAQAPVRGAGGLAWGGGCRTVLMHAWWPCRTCGCGGSPAPAVHLQLSNRLSNLAPACPVAEVPHLRQVGMDW